ncbi:PE family protein [Mycobacterium marinum MB2]|nr:PE family protein [Mycobacterium marinum MB2]
MVGNGGDGGTALGLAHGGDGGTGGTLIGNGGRAAARRCQTRGRR